MAIGVCGNLDMARLAARVGFDFVEMKVADLLMPLAEEKSFIARCEELRQSGLPCLAVNCFLPSTLKVTGPAIDRVSLERFGAIAIRRAAVAGVKTIVFGSGGARHIPDGFDRGVAREQFVDYCRYLAPLAEREAVTIAIEPLARGECNFINTVAEGAEIVREVAKPAVRLLVDSYHWGTNGEELETLVRHGGLISHVHVSTLPNRRPPASEPWDPAPFLSALKRGGCQANISIEAAFCDAEKEVVLALAELRRAQQACTDCKL